MCRVAQSSISFKNDLSPAQRKDHWRTQTAVLSSLCRSTDHRPTDHRQALRPAYKQPDDHQVFLTGLPAHSLTGDTTLVHSAIHSAPLLSAQPNTHIRAPANTQKICQCRARLYVPWILRNGVRPNKNSPATTHKICQHRLSKLSHCILSLTKKAALYTESDHIQN